MLLQLLANSHQNMVSMLANIIKIFLIISNNIEINFMHLKIRSPRIGLHGRWPFNVGLYCKTNFIHAYRWMLIQFVQENGLHLTISLIFFEVARELVLAYTITNQWILVVITKLRIKLARATSYHVEYAGTTSFLVGNCQFQSIEILLSVTSNLGGFSRRNKFGCNSFPITSPQFLQTLQEWSMLLFTPWIPFY